MVSSNVREFCSVKAFTGAGAIVVGAGAMADELVSIGASAGAAAAELMSMAAVGSMTIGSGGGTAAATSRSIDSGEGEADGLDTGEASSARLVLGLDRLPCNGAQTQL